MPRLFVLFAIWMTAASAVEIGQTWSEIEAELGRPVNLLEAGGKSIARWADLEVTFVDGRVKSFQRRNFAAEAASEERRRQDSERERRRLAALENETRRLEEERLAREEQERPERERREQAEKIAALETQVEAERQKLRDMTARLEIRGAEERNARITTLQKELSTLRLDLKRARETGETERVKRLRGELLAKESELELLSGQRY